MLDIHKTPGSRESDNSPEPQLPPPFRGGRLGRKEESLPTPQASFHRGPTGRRKGAKLIAFSWFAALLDCLLLIGVTLIFCSLLFFVNKQVMIQQLPARISYEIVAVIFAGLVCSYMIMLRAFLGFSLGEWACSLRLGSQSERLSPLYSLRVVLRVLVVLVSGVFILPLLSLLLGRDLAGEISGLKLFSLV